MRKEGAKHAWGQPPSHTASHIERRKKGTEKRESPDAKGEWDNLRKARVRNKPI